jgi:hypothetical protein
VLKEAIDGEWSNLAWIKGSFNLQLLAVIMDDWYGY